MSIIYIQGPPHSEDWRAEPIATIVTADPPSRPGPVFHTHANEPLQVATTLYRAGHKVAPHRHPPQFRPAFNGSTQEVLVMQRGRLLIHFFDSLGTYAGVWTLKIGDVCLIVGGGHSLEALTEVELVEVKTGPFVAGRDKVALEVASHV